MENPVSVLSVLPGVVCRLPESMEILISFFSPVSLYDVCVEAASPRAFILHCDHIPLSSWLDEYWSGML